MSLGSKFMPVWVNFAFGVKDLTDQSEELGGPYVVRGAQAGHPCTWTINSVPSAGLRQNIASLNHPILSVWTAWNQMVHLWWN